MFSTNCCNIVCNFSIGVRQIYKIAKGRCKKSKDIEKIEVIKEESDKIIFDKKEVLEKWKDFIQKLENEGEQEQEEDKMDWKIDEVTEEEILEALRNMGRGRAFRTDFIPTEVWKS